MAKQRVINTKFWSDPFVVDELNPLDRYLFLYLLTNEKTNIVGAYELSLRTMSNETGIEKEELIRMLKRLESRVMYVFGWVVFRKAIKHQNYNSPKIKIAIARELKEVPTEVKSYIEVPELLGKLLYEEYGIDTVRSGIALNLTKVTKVTKLNLTKVTTNVELANETPKVAKQPSADINEMFDYWEKTIGYPILADVKKNRYACSNLLKRYGKEGVMRWIDGVNQLHHDKYTKHISDFSELQKNLSYLMEWGKRKGALHGKAEF